MKWKYYILFIYNKKTLTSTIPRDGLPGWVCFQFLQLLFQLHLHLQELIVLLHRDKAQSRGIHFRFGTAVGPTCTCTTEVMWETKAAVARKRQSQESCARRGGRKKNSSHSWQYHRLTHKAAARLTSFWCSRPNTLILALAKNMERKRKEYPVAAVPPCCPQSLVIWCSHACHGHTYTHCLKCSLRFAEAHIRRQSAPDLRPWSGFSDGGWAADKLGSDTSCV